MGAHIALDSAAPSPRRRWVISLAGGTLLRRFTLASLLATVGIGSIFGWAGSRLAVDYALRSRTQAIAVQVAEFMAPRLVPEDFTGGKQARRVQFEFATRDLLGKAGILHAPLKRVAALPAGSRYRYRFASRKPGGSWAPIRSSQTSPI